MCSNESDRQRMSAFRYGGEERRSLVGGLAPQARNYR